MKDFKLGLYDSKNIFNHLLCLPFSLEERLQPWIYLKKKEFCWIGKYLLYEVTRSCLIRVALHFEKFLIQDKYHITLILRIYWFSNVLWS